MIGVSSRALKNKSLSEALEQLGSVTSCVEIYSEGLHDLSKNKEIPQSFDFRYSVHAPVTDINIGSIREPIRKASIDFIKYMADICNCIGSDVLVVHPGYYSYRHDLPDANTSLLRSLNELEDIFYDTGVRVCIENMPDDWDCYLFRSPEMDLGENGFVLDIGHANTTDTIQDFLMKDISHFHLHDNNGRRDEHSWIGSGNIDFEKIKDLLNNNNSMKILEHPCMDFVDRSMERLKQMNIK
ncbi:Xylose isomerase domain protein TIM barrel [Methanosalsum zhilinae DSM 4017]|uniref:Xylose isomerase domain protein TIM barrel n=1 Tax=Methanosalsum zhilinae (strain DSM 4017 / NBRC 107636 / OCM 62 / WeN5) TaxID=679901 RepID=F7XKM9_METZD|nr:sugar phosphate isomerase/epimerase family protein [Methanosalsum zhilinae]AEH60635.1 Xylose isomerase domain protein TIM barrel [Methanosalsum zhilinae DSM 4017]